MCVCVHACVCVCVCVCAVSKGDLSPYIQVSDSTIYSIYPIYNIYNIQYIISYHVQCHQVDYQ